MIAHDHLLTALLDLVHILEPQGIRLILGGGYGLFLKQLHLQPERSRDTLIAGSLWPEPRATNDLDLFLRPEIVTSSSEMLKVRTALEQLNYAVLPGREFMQFKNPVGVKVDLLVGPLGEYETIAKKRSEDRRVGPDPGVNLHAHRTDEAVGIHENPLRIPIDGTLSAGKPSHASIEIPAALPYIAMKLRAFRDQHEKAARDHARHHALDLYRTVAMLSEPEFQQAAQLAKRHSQNVELAEARKIARELFATPTAIGILRLREHPSFDAADTVELFIEALREILPLTD